MTTEEFKAAQATFPWHQVKVGPCNYTMVDRNTNEVPLFALLGVLEILSTKLANEEVKI